MVRVKICGITNLEDALASVAAGAHALGFNFYRQSPRYIEPIQARRIIEQLPASVLSVGVFVNEPDAKQVQRLATEARVQAIQLHGDEPPSYCGELKDFFVIKAFRVNYDFQPEQAAQYDADAILLDGFSAQAYGGTGQSFDWTIAVRTRLLVTKLFLAGGLNADNVGAAIASVQPYAVDACSSLEQFPGRKNLARVRAFIEAVRAADTAPQPTEQRGLKMDEGQPDARGYWGPYGGRFVPETLMAPLDELLAAYHDARKDEQFQNEFNELLRAYSGRPTPLFLAARLTNAAGGARIYLKREDLSHTGSHKINNALGQALLARRMGKQRIVAETGAGQHGVAVATVCALLGLECVIYMGTEDASRQKLNLFRMQLLGAEVRIVDAGSRTLKDAINEALRDWTASPEKTYYLLGSALGPHPYPVMVRDFQSVIGRETRRQIMEVEAQLPDVLVACVGGGSNSIGQFYPFLEDAGVRMFGVEAGGTSSTLGEHAARFSDSGGGRPGVLHGTKSYVLQDQDGQIASTHSISAGLDYPSIGPEHAFLHDCGRIKYVSATDDEALEAFQTLSKLEGIIPALESAHAISHALKLAREMRKDQVIIVNLSGRGDKDVDLVAGKLNGGHG